MKAPLDMAQYVVERMREAGMTLSALPDQGTWPAGFRSGHPEVLRSLLTDYPPETATLRAAVPSAAAITRLDEVVGWISDMPLHQRQVASLRMFVHPIGGQYLCTWRAIGLILHITAVTARNRFNAGVARTARKIDITQDRPLQMIPKTPEILARSERTAPCATRTRRDAA